MAKDRVDGGRGRRAEVVKKSKAQSKTPFYAALAVVAVVGVGALAYVATRPRATARTVDPATIVAGEPQGYLLGKPDAPVQVIEFADFECPACGQFATLSEPDIRKRLIEPGTISYRFYDYPLPMHKNTWPASNAAACADEQGKFWEFHDLLYQTQDRWNGEATDNPDKVMKDYARGLGLNASQFDQCIDSKKYQAKIQAHLSIAEQRKIMQTPTFIIGDQQVAAALPYDELAKYINTALAKAGNTPATPSGDTAKSTPVGGAAKKGQ